MRRQWLYTGIGSFAVTVVLLLTLIIPAFDPRVSVSTIYSKQEPLPALGSGENWYNTGWLYRKLITINETKISATLTNFPVLVYRASDNGLAVFAQNDGDDILFVKYSDNTTKLAHAIEKFDGATGELIAWVNVTSLSGAVDTKIWMYYGNFGCSSQQNNAGTWNNNYRLVHHMNDTTTSTLSDMSVSNFDGTKKGANEPIVTTGGIIEDAQSYDGTNDYVTMGNVLAFERTNAFSGSAWVYLDNNGSSERTVIGKYYLKGWVLYFYMGRFLVNLYNSGAKRVLVKTTNVVVVTNCWIHVAFTYTGNSLASGVTIYVNGSSVGTTTVYDTLSDTIVGSEPLYIGASGSASTKRWFIDGIIDETRVSNVVRNSSWILAEYNNQNSPSTFHFFGSAEAKVSVWRVVSSSINGSIYNVSTDVWILIDESINGSIYNFTKWNGINDTINGSIYNVSMVEWTLINGSFNGSIYNRTASWRVVVSSLNGSVYNRTAPWVVIDDAINGSLYNTPRWNLLYDEYVYAVGDSTQKVYKYRKSDLVKIAESADYGTTIYAMGVDSTYVYYAGAFWVGLFKKAWCSNLSLKSEVVSGASINSIVVDDTYVYAGYSTISRFKQYWKSNMTQKAQSGVTGDIQALAQDDTYVYAGGANQIVYQYWKSNMTKKAQSIDFGNVVRGLSADGTYVYVADANDQKIHQLWASNMTLKAEQGNYGYIRRISQDDTYLYAGGDNNVVYQLWKSNLTLKASSANYGGDIYALDIDDLYIYAGGYTTRKIYQYWKSNLTKKAESENYGGTIRDMGLQDTIINGSIYNRTAPWRVVVSSLNGSVYNRTPVWSVVDSSLNGSVYNRTASWVIIYSSLNGSVYNRTVWSVVDSSLNGSVYNRTAVWSVVDSSLNGSVYNRTAVWSVVDYSLNGSIYNYTAWVFVNSSLNGSVYNRTASWVIIYSSLNGSVYNRTVWSVVDSSLNGSIYNISIIVITNVYPVNGSLSAPVNVTVHLTVNDLLGEVMNITWWGSSNNGSSWFYLGNTTTVHNGTYGQWFSNASVVGKGYYWRVNVSDVIGNYMNETYHFNVSTTALGGVTILGGGNDRFVYGLVIGAVFMVPFGILLIRRRRRRRRT